MVELLSSTVRRIFGPIVLWVFCATACGNGNVPSQQMSCTPGLLQAFTGASGCMGTRTCASSGALWSSCTCPEAPDSAAPSSSLGPICQTDNDCPQGAFCLRRDSRLLFGGAPPEGTCVANCDSAGACATFADAVCVTLDGTAGQREAGSASTALCLERCAFGVSSQSKCHGRTHVACAPLDPSAGGYCRPVCALDTDCISGVCDPTHGVCVPQASKDGTFGQRCDSAPDAETGTNDAARPATDASTDGAGEAGEGHAVVCDGVCVRLNDTTSVCSHPCVFGDTNECAPVGAEQRRGGCLFVTQKGSIGDLGYCGQLCDCNNDCTEPTFVCDAFDNVDLERAFGRKGACTAPELVVARPLACSR